MCASSTTIKHGLNRELLAQFPLPLIAEMGRREHGETLRYASIKQFARDHPGLDGLADANVVRDQKPHWIKPESHDQRHELVRPRGDRQANGTGRRRNEG